MTDSRPWPQTAEALMRSRFEAFRDNDEDGRWYYLDAVPTKH